MRMPEWITVMPKKRVAPRGRQLKNTISVIRAGKKRLSISLGKHFGSLIKTDYVVIKVNPEERKMLIIPSEYEEGRVFRVVRSRSGTYVTCLAALRMLGVEPGRYPARWDEQEGGILIDFSMPVERAAGAELRARPEEEKAWKLLHEPEDWGDGTEDTSMRIDELLYGRGDSPCRSS